MAEQQLRIASEGATLTATLTIPAAGPVRGGLVPLHPASEPSRGQFLFRQLADILPPRGVAVLRFDRRPSEDGGDIPLELQAKDALAALQVLQRVPGVGDAPLGLWGFSQGAWAAPLAASIAPDAVAFLALIASTGVSPARQMRYGTAEQVRRAGYGADALAQVAELRAAYEEYLRGRAGREPTQALIDRMAAQPWFPLVYVPDELPPPGVWEDMDFDPEPIFARVLCPTLLFYGEDDEWTPADESIAVWRRAAAGDVTVTRLPGASHHPTLNGGLDIASISPLYTRTLVDWIAARLAPQP
ncbi:MAG TPA: alpha/beta hydrolase [Ktedonobacterales bacterium]|nr:alpha/beta hydrolase [Ktedonobacterales bacterium]